MSGKAIRETLGFLAVVASMVFVGLEIRQNTAVARAQARQFLTENHREFVLTLATEPDLLAAYTDRFPEGDGRTEAERQADYAMFVWLRHLENVFLQVQEGVADETFLMGYGFGGQTNLRSPGFADFWTSRRSRFNPDFVAAFEAEYDLAP